jgi:transcriptional regulator with GAF, ATPase, and Fis domain
MTSMAEPARIDLSQVDAFHALLRALAGALDVRDVFRHFSAVASRIVPHDEANLALLTDDGTQYRLYASTREGAPELVCCEKHSALRQPIAARLMDAVPGPERGLRSGVCAPVLIGDAVVGVFALFSRRPHAYSPQDLALVQRLVDYIAVGLAHQRLAEVARQAAVDRARAASIESSVELLRTLSGVLDIRTVFPQVSEIAKKVLTHDLLTMMFDDGGQIQLEVASSDGFPEVARLIKTNDSKPKDGFIVIDDLTTATLPIVEPADLRERLVSAGYLSCLAVLTRARDQEIGLGFWSKRAHAFGPQDVPVARRLADHVALAVSHEQLAEAARCVAEAQARAEQLELRVKSLTEQIDTRTHGRVVGKSREWNDVLKKAAQVAATDTTVLLTGESGTGKEVVARFIHRASPRRGGPFVALNCAALPDQLLEAELFGYERGAFTGAQQAKPGQIEIAAGGVLLLDEIGEISLGAQAKLLRVLQEREFSRLGSTRVQKANLRVIAASNRDLAKALQRGEFREDLFYRLQVFDIRLPPLRERPDDILPLSEAFLAEIGRSFGRPPAGLSRDARDALLQRRWPGNARELRNALERAAILCDGGLITSDHLLAPPIGPISSALATTDLATLERQAIATVVKEVNGNKAKAARRLGLSRTQLYTRLKRYGLA